MCVPEFCLVILCIECCLECCILFCVMCVVILYCPVLRCSTLPPGINPFSINNNKVIIMRERERERESVRVCSYNSICLVYSCLPVTYKHVLPIS